MGVAEGAIVPSSVIMMPGPGSVSVASPLERGGRRNHEANRNGVQSPRKSEPRQRKAGPQAEGIPGDHQ